MTDLELSGRVALVTGAGQGLGAAISGALYRVGANVILNYLPDSQGDNQRRAEQAAKELGNRAVPLPADVRSTEQITAMFEEAAKRFGHIDIVINNAGILRDKTLKNMTAEQWQDVIDTNLGGCFNMAKAVFEGMQSRGYGRIVNIGSINGQAGQYGQVNYAAAKSGIHGFTKALAQEGARSGVTVNAIAPGYIDTDMVAAVPQEVLGKIIAKIPVNRLGKAEEIARGVAFLVDENAGFVTGSTLSINGGQHMY